MTAISIDRLTRHPDALDPVARWIHQEWGAFSGRSLEQTRARFSDEGAWGGLPMTFVALDGADPLGIASLRERDSVDWDPGRAPWICNVYVAPSARGRGIAARLCRRLEDAALELGFPAIFLASKVAEGSVYERIGYRVYGSVALDDTRLSLMMRDLRATDMENLDHE